MGTPGLTCNMVQDGPGQRFQGICVLRTSNLGAIWGLGPHKGEALSCHKEKELMLR